jgi:uncharacterized protein YjbJ (UPF0337 family)
MDWDRIEGNWKQFTGHVKAQWGELTDDDIKKINGKREQLEGKIQARYGYAKDGIKKDVDRWPRKPSLPSHRLGMAARATPIDRHLSKAKRNNRSAPYDRALRRTGLLRRVSSVSDSLLASAANFSLGASQPALRLATVIILGCGLLYALGMTDR